MQGDISNDFDLGNLALDDPEFDDIERITNTN